MRLYSLLLILVLGSTCLFAPPGFAGTLSKPDATVSVKVESWVPRGEDFGYTWGNGMLRMTNGITEVFTLQGLGIRGNEDGIADMEADGQVFNLKNAADFAGTYQPLPGAATAGTMSKALVLKNEKGVVVVLKVETETNPYLALDVSDQHVKVTIERLSSAPD
jgi:hypothetical protein